MKIPKAHRGKHKIPSWAKCGPRVNDPWSTRLWNYM